MSRSLRIEFPSALYHLTSRGDIYLTDDNYRGQIFLGTTKDRQCAEVNRQKIEGESPLSGKA
jgi:hypothetical protein